MEFLENTVTELSVSLGFPVDQLKYVICLFLAYPLAAIHRSLPDSPTLKHFFSGSIGFAMGWFCFGTGMFHSLFTSLVTYLIVSFVKGPLAPKLVFLFALGHLSISHIIRQINNYGGYELDYTGPQMVLVIKLTSFAYNVFDGQNLDKCIPEQKERAISKVPSLLEYFGFIYFFGGFLAGPAIEIGEYLKFTDMSLFPTEKDKKKIPSSFLPAMKAFLIGILCFGGIILSGKFPIQVATTTEFLNDTSFFYRFMYVQIAITLVRFQYYFIWMISEGACILAGLGYNGEKNGKIMWDRVSNVDIWALETSQNMKSITDSWNKKTNLWLRFYVYLRLTPANGKPTTFATLMTYMTSAFWHGFYLGYYVTFFTGAIMTIIAREIRKYIRPFFLEDDGKTPKASKKLYDLVSWIATVFTLNYICSSFVLLDGKTLINLYISLFFIVHVVAIIIYVFIKVFAKQLTDVISVRRGSSESSSVLFLAGGSRRKATKEQ